LKSTLYIFFFEGGKLGGGRELRGCGEPGNARGKKDGITPLAIGQQQGRGGGVEVRWYHYWGVVGRGEGLSRGID